MNPLGTALLLISIALSSGRNILSKSISDVRFGKKSFFLLQAILFFSGAVILTVVGAWSFSGISLFSLIYALLYAVMLLSAQWCYTAALGSGFVSVCATVYSLNFILPTISGMLFWNEPISLLKILGILVVIPTLILSSSGSSHTSAKESSVSSHHFIIPAILAMLSSGMLGILQKGQSKSPYPDQLNALLTVAFLVAGSLSLICGLIIKSAGEPLPNRRKSLSACGIGLCFGSCNLLNTILAGKLPSAVVFPLLNIGSILLSLILAITIFRERFTKRHAWILSLGALSILLIAISP